MAVLAGGFAPLRHAHAREKCPSARCMGRYQADVGPLRPFLQAAVQCAQENSCSASCSSADCMQHQPSSDGSNTGADASGATPEVISSSSSSRRSGRRARCRRWLLKHLKLSALRAEISEQALPSEAVAAAISHSQWQSQAFGSVQQPTRLELLLQSPTPHHYSRQLRIQHGYSSTPPLIIAQQTLPPPQQLPQPEQQQEQELVQQLPVVWGSLRGYLSALATLAVITHTIIQAAAKTVMEQPTRNLAQLILSVLSFFPLFFRCTVYTCCTGLLAAMK